jgi:streptogramin lyase
VWFTEFFASKIGVFDPEKKIFQEWETPTKDAGAYAIVIDGHGLIWFSEYKANNVAYFNPTTDTIRELPLQTPHSNIRFMSLHPDGRIIYAASGSNIIGLISNEESTHLTQTRLQEENQIFSIPEILLLITTVGVLAALFFLRRRRH